MKKFIILLAAIIISLPLSAQKRGIMRIYLLQHSTESVVSDGYVNVKFSLTHEIPYWNPVEQPRLQIDITNMSDETIILDINKSLYKMNEYEESLSNHIDTWDAILSPGECYTMTGINLLPYEAKSYATDVFWYWKHLKEVIAVASDDNLFKGDKVTYDESNTPITIGSSIVYHSENDPTEYIINTMYHAFMKLAPDFSSFTTLLNSYDIDQYLNNTISNWKQNDNLMFLLRRIMTKQK